MKISHLLISCTEPNLMAVVNDCFDIESTQTPGISVVPTIRRQRKTRSLYTWSSTHELAFFFQTIGDRIPTEGKQGKACAHALRKIFQGSLKAAEREKVYRFG